MDRIRASNEDPNSPFSVDEAVVFGDILSDKARLQSANVGIRLTSRKEEPEITAAKHAASLLRQLRGKSALSALRKTVRGACPPFFRLELTPERGVARRP